MANLNGFDIGTNYKGIINLGTVGTPTAGINLPLTAVATGYKVVTDGMGNVSPLQLAQDAVKVDSLLTVSGNVFSANTFTGTLNANTAGAASTPPASFTGTWFSGGTSTTTKPQLLIEPTGTTSTNWSTSGTGLGINAASSFTGNLIDSQINGVSKFSIDINGNVASNIVYNRGISFRDTGAFISSDANNQIKVYTPGAAAGDPMFLQIGGNTVTYPALKRNGTNIDFRLANDSAFTGFTASASTITATSIGQNYSPYFTLINTTSATSSTTNQWSPGLVLQGSFWNGTVSLTGAYRIYNKQTGNASAGVGHLVFGYSNNGGAEVESFRISHSGAIYVNNSAGWVANMGGSTGCMRLTDGSGNPASTARMQFGEQSTAAPMLRRGGANLELRFGDDSYGAGFSVGGVLVGSAILQADSTTKGFLPPRMTTTDVNAIVSPADGLVVYNTTIAHLCVRQGGAWVRISHSPM
jgi:hypothetical protein